MSATRVDADRRPEERGAEHGPVLPSRARRRRTVLLVVIVAVLVVAAAMVRQVPEVGEPLDPGSTAPDGLRGLVDLLSGLDVDVDISLDPPTDTSARVFVPVDLLNTERRERLLDWVDDGGTLIVAGADARTHGLSPAGGSFTDVVGATVRAPRCALEALEPVGAVEHADWTTMAIPEDDAATWCFPVDEDRAWLVTMPRGRGTIVALGSATPFTNAWLDRADNAVLAAALLGPATGDALVIVPRPPIGDGDVPILDLVPSGFWRGLVLSAIALLLVVSWRARRLGQPVPERLPPVLPSAELAHSVARLLQRAGDTGAAAARLREDTRMAATRALGTPANIPVARLVELIAERAGVPPETATLAVVDAPVHDDDGLIAVATASREVRDALHHPRPTISPERSST